MNKLAICVIAKNETQYLSEWVAYHKVVGTDHFYIYDNDSDYPIKNQFSDPMVTVIDFPGRGKQMPSYDHCLKNFGNDNEWIAFIDADEFIVPKQKDSIPEILEDYKQFGGLGANWMMFGSNNHKTAPSGLLMENYTKGSHASWEVNNHIKSIVQPKFVEKAGRDPHHFEYKSNYFAMSENYKYIPGPFSPHSSNSIQINHYFTKSEEEFKAKVLRGRADTANPNLPGRKMSDFYEYDTKCNIEEKSILRFLEKTKKRMEEFSSH